MSSKTRRRIPREIFDPSQTKRKRLSNKKLLRLRRNRRKLRNVRCIKSDLVQSIQIRLLFNTINYIGKYGIAKISIVDEVKN